MANTTTSGIKPEYIIGSILALGAIGFVIYKRKSKETDTVDLDAAAPVQTVTQTTTTPTGATVTQTVTINKDLWLKKGIKGAEVKELQKLLGVTADGDFGNNTEAALLKRKGTKEITLNNFAKAPDVNNNALAMGAIIMANKTEITGYKATKDAAGGFNLTTDPVTTWGMGKQVGKIVGLNTAKTKYVVEFTDYFITMYAWVNATDVKKI